MAVWTTVPLAQILLHYWHKDNLALDISNNNVHGAKAQRDQGQVIQLHGHSYMNAKWEVSQCEGNLILSCDQVLL